MTQTTVNSILYIYIKKIMPTLRLCSSASDLLSVQIDHCTFKVAIFGEMSANKSCTLTTFLPNSFSATERIWKK